MIRGGIVGGYYGIIGTGGAGLSEADVIALIEARDGVIDGTPGILPVAAAVQKLKLAPDNSGLVRTLVERVHHAVPRSGSFSVYTHAHYRGPFAFAPFPGEDTDDIFYYTAHQYFARVRQVSPGNYQWRQTTIADALGVDAVWLGHVATQAAALARIGTFDETKSYFAYTTADRNVMLLSNSSYVAGSGESRTYEWRSITGDTAERVARLEDYTPTYWQQVIDAPAYINGDDTETFDGFDVELLDKFLEVDARAYGQLILDVKLEKLTDLRIDSTIRIKHGTTTIKEESLPLQDANTEFTKKVKVDVTDVSDGITVEIETENSDDTNEDVTVAEVKLGILTGLLKSGASYYWGTGQTGRLEGRRQLVPSNSARNARLTFETSPNEDVNGGVRGQRFVPSADVDSNRDTLFTGDTVADGEFLTFPVGRWNLFLDLISSTHNDTAFAGRFMRVTTGTDDTEVPASSGYSSAFTPEGATDNSPDATATGHTVQLHIPDFEVTDPNQQYYFKILSIDNMNESHSSYYLRVEAA